MVKTAWLARLMPRCFARAVLDPGEAAQLAAVDPDSITTTADQLCSHFGLTPAELRREMETGRLRPASGTSLDTAEFAFGAVLTWTNRPDLPGRVRRAIGRATRARRTS